MVRRRMTYREWVARWGDTIANHGAHHAALCAQVPDAWAKRWTREARRGDAIARSMGGTSRFFLPLGA